VQALRLAESWQEPALIQVAEERLGATLYYSGELIHSREHFERSISLYDVQRHRSQALLLGPEAGVSSLSTLAITLWRLGYPDQALKSIREALALARELSHPVSLCFALYSSAALNAVSGEVKSAQEEAEAVIGLANEHGFPDWMGLATILRGWSVAMQGQPNQVIEAMRRMLDAIRAAGVELLVPWHLQMLAEAYKQAGEWQEGLATVAEAMSVMSKTGQAVWWSYTHRLKGDLLLALSEDNQTEAESCFREAIDFARRHSARSRELQATMSLARLWQKQGKKEEARQLLAEIHGWFTEGFGTRDLRQAKALRDELC
jgi:predicted ATPase